MHFRHPIAFFAALALAASPLAAQDTDLLLNTDMYHYVDRVDIRGYADTMVHTDLKPYGRAYVSSIFAKADTSQMSPRERAWHSRMRLLADDDIALRNRSTGLLAKLPWVYKNGRDALAYGGKDLRLFVNPSAHLAAGMELNTQNGQQSDLRLLNNSRGLCIRGTLYNKIGFYTEVYDNQIFLPQFAVDRLTPVGTKKNLFGEIFVKPFKTRPNAVDFLSSRAYITFAPIKAMRVKFGKDRAFWGNGYQSVLLSDYAADYLFLNINTRIWKFEYSNHFTQLFDYIPNKTDTEGTHPRKYGVWHQLAYKPTKNISIALFESVVYLPNLPNGKRGFEVQYLNPIIFYRAAEQALGSPDNGFLGGQFKVNFLRHFQVYGQGLIDDYNFGVRKKGSGYWGNKLAGQLGAKYIDAFNIPMLDIQLEYNAVRPYTYQHFGVSGNYAHYAQSLGHAAGANVRDFTAMVNYHPIPALNAQLIFTHLLQGRDTSGLNFGGNINLPYTYHRPQDFNVVIGQGQKHTVNMLYGRLTYQFFKTDIYFEGEGRFRMEGDRTSVSALVGVRFGIPSKPMKF